MDFKLEIQPILARGEEGMKILEEIEKFLKQEKISPEDLKRIDSDLVIFEACVMSDYRTNFGDLVRNKLNYLKEYYQKDPEQLEKTEKKYQLGGTEMRFLQEKIQKNTEIANKIAGLLGGKDTEVKDKKAYEIRKLIKDIDNVVSWKALKGIVEGMM